MEPSLNEPPNRAENRLHRNTPWRCKTQASIHYIGLILRKTPPQNMLNRNFDRHPLIAFLVRS